jgi:uncharacterized protein (TIGR02118 family)
MSILIRLHQDDRESFAAKWEYHGTLVSQLPLIRTYLQNHVVETITRQGVIEADGIVELKFDRPEDMATAFASPNAAAVKADEPGFLGHGTGYALETDTMPLCSPDGAKLIAVWATNSDPSVERLVHAARSIPGFKRAVRDVVASVIPRPEMRRPPQRVSTFLHLLFADTEAASSAGRTLVGSIGAENAANVSVFRVRTNVVIHDA